MATQTNFTRSFAVNAAMSAGRIVALSSNGSIGLAAINTKGLGVIQDDTTSGAYENPAVRFPSTGSVRVSVTGLAATPADTLYSVTNGQLSGTNGAGGVGAQAWGVLLETTGGAPGGALFEVLPIVI